MVFRRAVLAALLIAGVLMPSAFAQAPDVVALVDRYARGEFDAVAGALDATKDFNTVLKQLKSSAPSWMAAGGAADRPRRELAAATFALEAARAGQLDDWKLVQSWMGLENIYWHAPPQLVEWGCELLRARTTPAPIERVWHLASIAVADRAIDYEFLIGSPWEGRANPKDEIKHLEHSVARFPYERRFALAQGIAAEWRLFPSRRTGAREAEQIFDKLRDDEQVSGEANVRLGVMQFRNNNTASALRSFDEAEQRSREPYVIYLARFFRGQVRDRQKRVADAEREYRGALSAVPRAQSASFALAALLSSAGRRSEAAAIVNTAVTADPRPLDPWRAYGEADARFWPELIGQLRAEIRPRMSK